MRMSRSVLGPVLVVAWVLCVLVTAGCSSLGAGSQDESLGEKALQNLTPLGQTILADKTVTRGEYELAVQDTVSCLRTAGFTVSDPVNGADGSLTYMASYSPPEMATAGPDAPPPDSSKMDAANAACEQRKVAAEAVYILQHAGSEEEAKQASSELITCVEALGVKISVSKDSQDIRTILNEIGAAKEQGLISDALANSCTDSFRASTLRPLPGLSEALTLYKG